MVKALGNRFLLYVCLSCIAIPSVTQKRQEKAGQTHAATNSDICERLLVMPIQLAVLATDKPFDLFFAQPETGADLPVRFSRGFSPEHFLTERLCFCILSGHDSTSCCSFYSTTEGAFSLSVFEGTVQVFVRVLQQVLFLHWFLQADRSMLSPI